MAVFCGDKMLAAESWKEYDTFVDLKQNKWWGKDSPYKQFKGLTSNVFICNETY